MSYSIYKIISVKHDPNYSDDSLVAEFILDNGSEKKSCIFGGLPNKDKESKDKILENAEMLFKIGRRYSEEIINIEYDKSTNLDVTEFTKEIDKATDIKGIKDALKILIKPVSFTSVGGL